MRRAQVTPARAARNGRRQDADAVGSRVNPSGARRTAQTRERTVRPIALVSVVETRALMFPATGPRRSGWNADQSPASPPRRSPAPSLRRHLNAGEHGLPRCRDTCISGRFAHRPVRDRTPLATGEAIHLRSGYPLIIERRRSADSPASTFSWEARWLSLQKRNGHGSEAK